MTTILQNLVTKLSQHLFFVYNRKLPINMASQSYQANNIKLVICVSDRIGRIGRSLAMRDQIGRWAFWGNLSANWVGLVPNREIIPFHLPHSEALWTQLWPSADDHGIKALSRDGFRIGIVVEHLSWYTCTYEIFWDIQPIRVSYIPTYILYYFLTYILSSLIFCLISELIFWLRSCWWL